MSKVKDSIVLLVRMPGCEIQTPVVISYFDIWTPTKETWKFQTWMDWCKMYCNVEGRFTKSGTISLKNIKASVSRLAEQFYGCSDRYCDTIPSRVISYK